MRKRLFLTLFSWIRSKQQVSGLQAGRITDKIAIRSHSVTDWRWQVSNITLSTQLRMSSVIFVSGCPMTSDCHVTPAEADIECSYTMGFRLRYFINRANSWRRVCLCDTWWPSYRPISSPCDKAISHSAAASYWSAGTYTMPCRFTVFFNAALASVPPGISGVF